MESGGEPADAAGDGRFPADLSRNHRVLLCALLDIADGYVVAAPIVHPQRPSVELVTPGVALDARMIERLRQIGVTTVWVHHDATADLDHLLAPNLSAVRMRVYERLKEDFSRVQSTTVSCADIQAYRQVVIDLVCELIGNRHLAGLTEHLFAGPATLFTHGANVAMLSVIVGLELETYVVRQRPKLAADKARDMTALGIGAMLHDIGKTQLPEWVKDRHAIDPPTDSGSEADDEAERIYQEHPDRGYLMLRGCRAPAPATQVVLTHHQRWDGRGFPDMSRATGKRHRGPQQGTAIHIFSRIVAIADALDALLGHGRDRHPPAQALRRLAGEQFAGWFDPVVRDRLLRVLPPFAMGSEVKLSDGRAAVVVSPNMQQPCRPTVRLLGERDRLRDGRYPLLDLHATPGVDIVECGGHRVREHLFELPEEPVNWHRDPAAA